MYRDKPLGHSPSVRPAFSGEVIPCSNCGKGIRFYAGMNQSYYVSNDGAMSPYCG